MNLLPVLRSILITPRDSPPIVVESAVCLSLPPIPIFLEGTSTMRVPVLFDKDEFCGLKDNALLQTHITGVKLLMDMLIYCSKRGRFSSTTNHLTV